MPPKPQPSKWNVHKNWTWRLRGKAVDGMVVTLGRYETEEEAQADLARLTLVGTYRDLVLQPIEPAPEPAGE